MKAIPILLSLALCAPVFGQGRKPVMRDAATHEQLSLAYRKASQADPMRTMKPSEGGDPSTVNRPRDIVASSDILCFRGMATLVPKRAIIHMPAQLADRMKFQQGALIKSWPDFYAANRGWITTVEVSREQAEGNKELAEELSTRISKSTNLVVATFRGGPVSMLPQKPKEEQPQSQAAR